MRAPARTSEPGAALMQFLFAGCSQVGGGVGEGCCAGGIDCALPAANAGTGHQKFHIQPSFQARLVVMINICINSAIVLWTGTAARSCALAPDDTPQADADTKKTDGFQVLVELGLRDSSPAVYINNVGERWAMRSHEQMLIEYWDLLQNLSVSRRHACGSASFVRNGKVQRK